MSDVVPSEQREQLIELFRRLGGRFAFLHGSRVDGTARPDSDLDVAVWFGREVDAIDVAVRAPAGVDVTVLDSAPPWIAGRIALHGERLFDDDPPARVAWQAETRKVYLDERIRWDRIREEFVTAHGRP